MAIRLQRTPTACWMATMIIAHSYAPSIATRAAARAELDRVETGALAEMRSLRFGRKRMTHIVVDRVSLHLVTLSILDGSIHGTIKHTLSVRVAQTTVTCSECAELLAAMPKKASRWMEDPGPPTEDDLKRRNEYGAERDVQKRLNAALAKLPQTS